ncbi:MAG: cytochrome c oxidase assembly protein [Gammaproteobacteria bacterium]
MLNTQTKKTQIQKTTRKILITVGLMFGFAFAMIPFYNSFCKITGLNGKVELVPSKKQEKYFASTRQVLVELDSTVNKALPIHFKPTQRQLQVHPGTVHKTYFTATNTSNKTLVFQAIPSISPGLAAQHFQKLECFCFQRQELKAGATVEFPLQFVLSNKLPQDIEQLTLSYTIYEMENS